MADTINTTGTEQAESLTPVATPALQSEEIAPLVLASNETVQVAANSAPAAAPATANYEVVVKAPPAGGMLAYLVGPGAHIVLDGIDLNKATLAQEGGNLRITLANGAEVLLLDYVSSAQTSSTVVVTPEGTLPAQQLLAALEGVKVAGKDVTDVEPAAGPQAGGEGGGLLPPTILGLGVGEGEGIFSSVIDPFAIPRPVDAITTNEFPFETGPNSAGTPPVVGPVNNPPFARNDAFSTAVNKPITMTPAQLLVNDTDPDGDTLTIVSVQGASHGTVAIVNGQVVFTPEAGFTGTGSYSYTITDGKGGTSTADVIIQIDPDQPNLNEVIAADDAGRVVEGRAITINVLANDSDPEGDALVPGSVRIIRQPSEGTVTANPDGTISFQSNDLHSAAPRFVTFTYEVMDARGAADTATVTIEITPSLNTVIAVDDTGEIIPAGASKTFNVTGNDIDPQGDNFHITSIVQPTRGSASFDPATGTIVYNSAPSATGYTEVITYTITDDRGATDTATLTVRVEPTNNVSAVDDTADMKAGQDVRIAVKDNDFDAQGDTFEITRIVSQPTVRDGSGFGAARGSVTINADGTITFTDTPGARESAVVEFTYEIRDARGALDTAVVRVTIEPAANGVDANNDTLTVQANAPRADVTDTLRANDFDPQGDTFTITAITQPTVGQGTVELVNGHVFFTPANGYDGPVIFTYTITDSKGATDSAQVVINVQEPINTDLNAGNDAFTTPFNTNLNITAASLLANDNDPEGSVLNAQSIISFTQPANGTLTRDASGNFVYNPNDTFRGTDSFTYTIRDAQGDEATATVTIRVAEPAPVDNPVDAVNDLVIVHPGETRTVNALTNDSAPDGGLAFVRIVDPLPAGVTHLGNGVFSYTADPFATGTSVSFRYEVRDADGDTDIATVTFKVEGPVVDRPVDAVNDAFTTSEDTPISFTVANILANDSAPDGGLAFVRTVGPLPAGLSFNGTTFTYNPPANFNGSVSFQYEVRDVDGDTDIATVTINVGAVNDGIDANPDNFTTGFNTNLTITPAQLLVNDRDLDTGTNAGLSITGFTQPAHGTVTRDASGNFIYNPEDTFSGTDTFTYSIIDAQGETDTTTVTIVVGARPDQPVDAVNDAFTTNEDTPITFTVANILANDSAPDGGLAFVRVVGALPAGLVFNGTTFTYNPPANFNGDVSFQYEVRDADGDLDTATVTIHVTPVDDPVDAVNDVFTTSEDTPISFTVANILANDSAPDGGLAFVRTVGALPAGLVFNGSTFTYTPPANFNGSVSFQYEVRDVDGDTDIATVTINVGAVNDGIDAVNDAFTTGFNTNLTITPAQLLVNDRDLDTGTNAGLNITGFTQPSHGTVTRDANGNFIYNPADTFSGTDTFTYTIVDPQGETDTATVTIVVAERPNSVVAVDDQAVMGPDVNTLFLDAYLNDYDPQGDTFQITRIVSISEDGSVTGGTATINAAGQIVYTNDTRGEGIAHIVYEITDSRGATSQATITIDIKADFNDVTAVDDKVVMGKGVSVISIDAIANDFDDQGDTFSITRIVSVSEGRASIGADGKIIYENGTKKAASAEVVYEITDSKGATSQATITIDIRADNNANSVIARNDSERIDHGDSIRINVLKNDSDPQGDKFDITKIVKGPAIGSVHINGDGTVTYKASSAVNGAYTATFTYQIKDSKGATDTATVTVKVGADHTSVIVGNDGRGPGCDPLTIDLEGNGFSISMLSQSHAFFDLDANGTRDATAWLNGSDDAILAFDRNGDGSINGITEVFGAAGVDGFTELRHLEDSNEDGILDASDANWSQMKLWLDANHNGVSDEGELLGLDAFGITSINLNGTAVSMQYGDAHITHLGTVTYADGHTTNAGSIVYTNDGDKVVQGTAADDIMIYNSTADTIDGGQGFDTMKVLTASEIVINHDTAHSIESIDLNNNGADHLSINVADVLNVSDNGILTITGDAVDDITLLGNVTRGDDVTQNGQVYNTYVADNGGTVLVEVGLTVHTQEDQH